MIDLHLHAGWTDFHAEDQARRSPEEQKRRISQFLRLYEEKHIELSRDAGGYEGTDGRVIRCAGMITSQNYREDAFVKRVLSSDAAWVKIFATGGVGMPTEEVTQPLIPEDHFRKLVDQMHRSGKRVMVHCWGGPSLDWSIETRVDSIEHGVFLGAEQAERMAEAEIPLIPTTAIYRLLAEEPQLFGIPEVLRERAKRACESQCRVVLQALEAGVIIGHGTDFYADPALVQYADYERKILQEYGLTEEQATAAGTSIAEKILNQKIAERPEAVRGSMYENSCS